MAFAPLNIEEARATSDLGNVGWSLAPFEYRGDLGDLGPRLESLREETARSIDRYRMQIEDFQARDRRTQTADRSTQTPGPSVRGRLDHVDSRTAMASRRSL